MFNSDLKIRNANPRFSNLLDYSLFFNISCDQMIKSSWRDIYIYISPLVINKYFQGFPGIVWV